MGQCIIQIKSIKDKRNLIIYSSNCDDFVSELWSIQELVLLKIIERGTYNTVDNIRQIIEATRPPNFCSWRGDAYCDIIKRSKKTIKTIKVKFENDNGDIKDELIQVVKSMFKIDKPYFDLKYHEDVAKFLADNDMKELLDLLTAK